MLVKVTYLNGAWEYVRHVENVVCENAKYKLFLKSGRVLMYDSRLKLELLPEQRIFGFSFFGLL